MHWIDVTPRSPCPMCGKDHWCSVSDDGAWCNCHFHDDGTKKVKWNSRGEPYFTYCLDPNRPNLVEPRYQPEPKERSPLADPDVLHTAYGELLRALPLSPEHRDDLLIRRKLTGPEIARLGYRSLARGGRAALVATVQKSVPTLDGIPGFVWEKGSGAAAQGHWTVWGRPGLLIPVRDLRGRIVGLKVRADEVPCKCRHPRTAHRGGDAECDKCECKAFRESNKYRWLTSRRDGDDGPMPGAAPHVPLADVMPGGAVRFTEGEIKADVATLRTGVLTLGASGVGSYAAAMPMLRELGAPRVLLAFDADWRTNRHVAVAMRRAIEYFTAQGVELLVETWELSTAKGIDDLLVGGGAPQTVSASQALLDLEAAAPTPPEPAPQPEVTAESPALDLLGAIEARLKTDKGALFEAQTIAAILAMSKGDRPNFVRLQELARKYGLKQELQLALRDLRAAEEARAAAGDEAPPQNSQERAQHDLRSLAHVDIGEETVVLKDDTYQRAMWRVDQMTGERYLKGYASLTNWSLRVDRAVRYVEDGGHVVYSGALMGHKRLQRLTWTATDMAEMRAFQLMILKARPTGLFTDPQRAKLALEAVKAFSASSHTMEGHMSTGYHNGKTYLMPSVKITDGQVEPNTDTPCTPQGDLAGRYDLTIASREVAEQASRFLVTHCLDVHDHSFTLLLLAHIVGAPLVSRMRWTRNPLFLEGAFESGKTITCRIFLNLFEDCPVIGSGGGFISATSTAAGIQKEMHFLRDCPVLVDDVKLETVDGKQLFRMLQGLYDNTGRRRLSQTLESQQEHVARCQVIMTGEEIPPHVASSVSRCLVLHVQRNLKTDMLAMAEAHRHLLRTLTPYWIAWTQRRSAEQMQVNMADLRIKGGRSEMFARQLMTALANFFAFLREEFPGTWQQEGMSKLLDDCFAEAREAVHGVVEHTSYRTQAESKEEGFVQALAQAIRGGKAVISSGGGSSTMPVVGMPHKHRQHGWCVDVMPHVALDVVSKMTGQRYSLASLGELLRDRKMICETRPDGRPTIRRKSDGLQFYVWRMPARLLVSEETIAEIDSKNYVIADP